ncbi:hypothetical protein CLV31_1276 [Algoriphagus aquaeductus]|uniref:ATP synthase protein I n=1 Tax=Algoriphagus aquaeductus TaxID=475299 RepID=A0A326RMK5_9BACT|nr:MULTISPECIES: hypothetical protein [Algoriphagus]PZV76057.1 hypothetical protein CLV31_1276 [Algoriphagus aquaeductus]
MNLLTNFHFRFFLFSTLIAGLILVFSNFLPQTIHTSIWSIFGFVAGLSYLVSALALWLYKKSPENFLQIKLLGMVIRILSSLGFIAILVVMGVENIILFIVNFFILFLFYLTFDIYTFISNLRPISK